MSDRLAQLLASRPWLLADGAMGSNLFLRGLVSGEAPELWNIEHPARIAELHAEFIAAGSDIILTNSFGGTRHRLKLHHADGRVAELNERAAQLAREAVAASGRPVVVAGSMGPTGEIFEPIGPLSIAAAADATIARCSPLFYAMGQRTIVIGENPADANVTKLTGNFLIASVLESLGEAFALVRKSGIDSRRFLDSLTGTLFSAPVYRTYGSIIAEEKIPSGGFKMSLALKDMRLALAAADAKTVPMPIASLIRDHLLEGVAQGEGDSDWSGLARLSARSAGLQTLAP